MKYDKKFVNEYINNWVGHKELPKNIDKLYCEENNGTFIAVDDSTGNCWVEEFNTEQEAINWLKEAE